MAVEVANVSRFSSAAIETERGPTLMLVFYTALPEL